ncbi:protein KTI12 [Kwoniella mangroviensis CBS 10435]|uniref:Protein KTI12 n=1 Tax=Kwoniella mangroviensis CBS 10435 TaxID=1331196 RepID=A0A1B9IW03_9TREE|nr:protein KTI12 [Kwoniella mangroviensis CBS 8507]OCF59720.1 protein KTI12 [Kwoniella mangroviensis CBS 10435]OCF66119.1 protein KTI12 [Kwoniella mangroviensis CBS 8507]OCF71241.1 protein KTI12 [Kwoniella mangroviensis CBS 8886]
MALVTISGFPCSGKTTRAKQLKEYFESRLSSPEYDGPELTVVIVDDDISHVPRSSYDTSALEKPARASLFSNVSRSLGSDTITIVDSANYIKGYRYQMYCAAREARVRVATIHVVAPPDKCGGWHEKRGECSYKPATFDNLIMRYEEPSSMVRWDSPLFTIPWDEQPPFEDIWNAILKGDKKPPPAAVLQRNKPPPNTLQTLTKTTQFIVTSLLSHISSLPGTSTYPIPSPPAPQPNSKGPLVLHLPSRKLTLSEMQRLKRQFEGVQVKAQQSGGLAASGNWTEEEVAVGFVRFLEEIWDTA